MLCVLIRIGDSNEYTQYTIFNIKKKITLNYPKSAVVGFYSKRLKKEFETAVVNDPSVFEPLKFYCMYLNMKNNIKIKIMTYLYERKTTTKIVLCKSTNGTTGKRTTCTILLMF